MTGSGSRPKPTVVTGRPPPAVVARDLRVATGGLPGTDDVNVAGFEIMTGSMVSLEPAACGRTLLLALAGRLVPASGLLVIGPAGLTPQQARVALLGPDFDDWLDLQRRVNSGGLPTPERMLLMRSADRLHVDLCDPHTWRDDVGRRCALLADAICDAPDLIGVDGPTRGLDDDDADLVLERIRDLVVLHGHTVLLVSSYHLLDQYVDDSVRLDRNRGNSGGEIGGPGGR